MGPTFLEWGEGRGGESPLPLLAPALTAMPCGVPLYLLSTSRSSYQVLAGLLSVSARPNFAQAVWRQNEQKQNNSPKGFDRAKLPWLWRSGSTVMFTLSLVLAEWKSIGGDRRSRTCLLCVHATTCKQTSVLLRTTPELDYHQFGAGTDTCT